MVVSTSNLVETVAARCASRDTLSRSVGSRNMADIQRIQCKNHQSIARAVKSEWTKRKMLIFCVVLIFALIFMIFDKYLSYHRWYKLTFETFYVHEKCKISDFKFSKATQQHKVWWVTYYGFCWKLTTVCSSGRILQINKDWQRYSHG